MTQERFEKWKETGNNWGYIDVEDNALVIWQAAYLAGQQDKMSQREAYQHVYLQGHIDNEVKID